MTPLERVRDTRRDDVNERRLGDDDWDGDDAHDDYDDDYDDDYNDDWATTTRRARVVVIIVFIIIVFFIVVSGCVRGDVDARRDAESTRGDVFDRARRRARGVGEVDDGVHANVDARGVWGGGRVYGAHDVGERDGSRVDVSSGRFR